MKRLILFFAIVFLCAGLRAASVLPVGEGKFTYKDYPPFADRPVDVHYYIPASGDVRRMPIVLSLKVPTAVSLICSKPGSRRQRSINSWFSFPTSIWKGFLCPIIRKSVS